MPATLDLYINLSAPARRALVQSYDSLGSASAPDFVVRDTVRLRLHFMTVASGARVGTTFDLGGTATINFGAKPAATFASATSYLFYSSSFTRDASDPTDVVFTTDVNLNTTELVTALGSAATLGVKFEVEVDDGATLQTVAQADANAVNDVIDGTSSSPTGSTPAYPAAPAADSFLTGNAAGTAWSLRNAAAARVLLGIDATSPVKADLTVETLTATDIYATNEIVTPSLGLGATSLVDPGTGGVQKPAIIPIPVNGNTTGVIGQTFEVFASATFTDPAPATGGYVVRIRNGTATIGGTGYSEGVWWRVYHSGAWTTRRIGYTDFTVPSTATSTGTPGQIAYDSTHFYICTAANTWRRVAIASW